MTEIMHSLASSRLLTLTGAAGCGKTRLALRVAAEVGSQYEDGVHWVELARLSEARLLPQAVAKALNVVEEPSRPLVDGLLDALHNKPLLLVLDNCEHLLSACAQLVETLLKATGITILTTSREPLHVKGERLYPVPPMALPPARLPVADADQFDSIQLFVERASAILPNFTLTSHNSELVTGICRHLDGIPLAIELASARVNMLSLEQIAARLHDRFELLVSASSQARKPLLDHHV